MNSFNYKKIINYSLLIIFAFSLISVYSTSILNDESRIVWQNYLFNIAPLIALIAGIYTLKKYGIKSIHGKTILFLTIGVGLLFTGEMIWTFFELYLNIDPYPSIADIFYLLAYPFFFYGILNQLKLGKIDWNKKNISISIFMLVLLSIVTIYYGIYYAYDVESSFSENLVGISYGVGDLILLAATILIINLSLEFKGGVLSKAWILFGIGIYITWIADIAYAIYWEPYDELVWFFRQIDYLWIAGYLFMAYSFLIQTRVITELTNNFKSSKNKK